MTGFVKCAVQAQKESRVHSEVGSATSVYRRLHAIKPSSFVFCESHETGIIFTYFHILMNRISNLIQFLSQVHNSLRNSDAITSLCQINK